jgi:hypothetical protein
MRKAGVEVTEIAGFQLGKGHRTLRIVRKGGKHATVPLARRTSRALDLYLGERSGARSSR